MPKHSSVTTKSNNHQQCSPPVHENFFQFCAFIVHLEHPSYAVLQRGKQDWFVLFDGLAQKHFRALCTRESQTGHLPPHEVKHGLHVIALLYALLDSARDYKSRSKSQRRLCVESTFDEWSAQANLQILADFLLTGENPLYTDLRPYGHELPRSFVVNQSEALKPNYGDLRQQILRYMPMAIPEKIPPSMVRSLSK